MWLSSYIVPRKTSYPTVTVEGVDDAFVGFGKTAIKSESQQKEKSKNIQH